MTLPTRASIGILLCALGLGLAGCDSDGGGDASSPSGGLPGPGSPGRPGGGGDDPGSTSCAGAPTLLADIPGNARGIVVDDTHVFVAVSASLTKTDQKGGLYKLPKAGGAPERIWEGGAWALTLMGDTVYWAARDEVWSVPRGGGTPTRIVAADGGSLWIKQLTTDGRTLFGADDSGYCEGKQGKVLAVGTDGTLSTLASKQGCVGDLVATGGRVYWINRTGPTTLASTLQSAASDGTAPTVIANLGALVGDDLALREGELVFTRRASDGLQALSRVESIPLAGGTPTERSSASFFDPMVVSDGASLVVTDYRHSTVSLLDVGTKTSRCLAAAGPLINHVAIDATHVYATAGMDATKVQRVSK
jgi:hypothetical protein